MNRVNGVNTVNEYKTWIARRERLTDESECRPAKERTGTWQRAQQPSNPGTDNLGRHWQALAGTHRHHRQPPSTLGAHVSTGQSIQPNHQGLVHVGVLEMARVHVHVPMWVLFKIHMHVLGTDTVYIMYIHKVFLTPRPIYSSSSQPETHSRRTAHAEAPGTAYGLSNDGLLMYTQSETLGSPFGGGLKGPAGNTPAQPRTASESGTQDSAAIVSVSIDGLHDGDRTTELPRVRSNVRYWQIGRVSDQAMLFRTKDWWGSSDPAASLSPELGWHLHLEALFVSVFFLIAQRTEYSVQVQVQVFRVRRKHGLAFNSHCLRLTLPRIQSV